MKQTAIYQCQRCGHQTTNGGELSIIELPAITTRSMLSTNKRHMAICTGCQQALAAFLEPGADDRRQPLPRDLINDPRKWSTAGNVAAVKDAAMQTEIRAQLRQSGKAET